MKHLEWLNISNNKAIDTLEPVFGMTRLKRLAFCESTDILDGNLRPLLRLPALKDIGFMERKHYNLTWYERDTGHPPPPKPEKKEKAGTVYDLIAASPVFPGLKRLGFKRTRLVWNRPRGEWVDVIVIRASAFDPKSFQVWIGVFSPQIDRILWDKPEEKKVSEGNCLVRETPC